MAPAIKGNLKIGRFNIPYRIYGNQGPFLVCVNGAQQTMAAWHSAVQRFSDSYRFVIYDGPGQAKGSILSGGPAVSMEEQVLVLKELVQQIAVAPIHLVGASWGAIIAAIYAARYCDKVSCLILGSFCVRPTSKMLEVIKHAEALYHAREGHKGAQLIIDHFGHGLSESHQRRMTKQFETMPEEHFHSFYEHILMIAKSGSIHDYVNLQHIRARTLLINGKEDKLVDNTELEETAKLIPHAEWRIVPGTGHFLHLENEAILEIYAEYLNRGLIDDPLEKSA